MEYQQEKKRRAKKLEKVARGSADESEGGGVSDEDAYEIKSGEDGADGQEADSQGFPYECSLCQDEFTDPIMTQCSHYFCEDCIMQSSQK